MNAAEFAKTHAVDADWVVAMGERDFNPLRTGDRCTANGYVVIVVRHYRNGMYEVRHQTGDCSVIDRNDLKPLHI